MFTRKTESPSFTQVIDKVMSELNDYSIDSPEFAKGVEHLQTLTKLQEVISPKRISPDTIALIAGNLAGIMLIVSYEHAHVITSKALSFAGKLR